MTSSTSSSTSGRSRAAARRIAPPGLHARPALAVALALAAGLAAGCRHPAPPEAPPRPVFVLMPIQNLGAGPAPLRSIAEALELALRARGLDLVAGDIAERALAKYRIRWSGGIDREAARALREELGVDGVVVSALESYQEEAPLRFALSMRLVSADDEPAILWMDGVARAGNDAPGLLGLGLVTSMKELMGGAIERLAAALAAHVDGSPAPEAACPGGGRWRPRFAYRAPVLDDRARRSVAVLPFVNQSGRRDAGELMVLHVARQLLASGDFEVVEPGVVRGQLLTQRLIMEGGVSLDLAQIMLTGVQADLLLSGYVRRFEERAGAGDAPTVEFSAYILDRQSGALVWSSTSRSRGDDGVFFFGKGKLSTASALSCRMSRSMVEGIAGARIELAERAAGPPRARPAPRHGPGARRAGLGPGSP